MIEASGGLHVPSNSEYDVCVLLLHSHVYAASLT